MSDKFLPEYERPVSVGNKQKKAERHRQWKQKQLHGKFLRETKLVTSRETCIERFLNKERESLIFPGQEQALVTNWIRKKIDW